jgi:hypothetical protein
MMIEESGLLRMLINVLPAEAASRYQHPSSTWRLIPEALPILFNEERLASGRSNFVVTRQSSFCG